MKTVYELALESGAVNASALQNEVRRLIEPIRLKALNAGEDLQLITEPQADFQRYEKTHSKTSGQFSTQMTE